ncbi:DUF4145 domain-containing protein [Sulfurovum sp.]|uniref:DUF4145 domain-containing protein n=1 Tax=Sulfurovum sp. TaxID=1969726 RepID=UPI00356A5B36
MSHLEYFPPTYGQGEFHCPHCNVYAQQFYSHLATNNKFPWQSVVDSNTQFIEALSSFWVISKCQRCSEHIIWFQENIVYPKKLTVLAPNLDLDEEIKADYLEAARILSDSPRSAAALLRLALQKLCKQLGEKGENINDDIKKMVSKGLNPLVQKSLDALRITGNNAVHPGEINLQEEPERVKKLFELINFIANKMITEPKEIEGFYSDLPEKAKAAIEKRDGES